MTIRPNLEELLAQFLKANEIYQPSRHVQSMTPKQIIRATMFDLKQNDVEGLCRYLFSEFKNEMEDQLAQESFLNDMCEFIK